MSAPTFEDYFGAAFRLAATVRRALDERGAVTRGEVRAAVEAFERIDKEAQVRECPKVGSAGITSPSAGSTSD